MNALDRLNILSSQTTLEAAEDTHCPQLSKRKQDAITVSQAVMPNGHMINLLKTLLTSVCEHNCYYCPFRSGRDFQRASFSPDEFARTFIALYNKKIAEGIFLSSGVVRDGILSQDKLIQTAEILRNKYHYRGYLHLKIMPGVEYSQVERSMQLADRVSINLEAPNNEKLKHLAPQKQFADELMKPLRWIDQIRKTVPNNRNWKHRWPSSVTQFVVGAVGDTDLELLTTTEYLYNQLHLTRTYYSAFNPIEDTPLENIPPTPPVRQNRLYQSSFLLRDYNFALEELPFDSSNNLPLDIDPKLAWAQMNIGADPIDIARADYYQLLRIPGIGPRSAKLIIKLRKDTKFRDIHQLSHLSVNIKRAAPFITLNGKKPAIQLSYL